MRHQHTRFKWIISLVVGLAGFGLNAVNIELFLGVNIIFGGIAAFVIVLAYGPIYGVVTTAISASYTYLLWGHPYAIIIFVIEAMLIGIFTRRFSRYPIQGDLLFWLVIGIPLVFLFYSKVLNLHTSATVLVALKQCTNSLLNISVASSLLLWRPLRQKLFGSHAPNASMSEFLSAGIMMAVGVILFFATAYQGRVLFDDMNKTIRQEMAEKSQAIEQSLNQLVDINLEGLKVVAEELLHEDFINGTPFVDAATFWGRFYTRYPMLTDLHLAPLPQGIPVNPKTVGQRINDKTTQQNFPPELLRSYSRAETAALEKALLNGGNTIVLMEEVDGSHRVNLSLVKLLSDQTIGRKHLIIGSINSNALSQSMGALSNLMQARGIKIHIVDHDSGLNWDLSSDMVNRIPPSDNTTFPAPEFFMEFPQGSYPAMVRWAKSSMVHHYPIHRTGWVVELKQPLSRFQALMQRGMTRTLATLFGLMSAFLMLIWLVGNFFNLQFNTLLSATAEVQKHITLGKGQIAESTSSIVEIENLHKNIAEFEKTLLDLFGENEARTKDLQITLRELKQTQTELELRTSQHARIEAYRDFLHTIGNLVTPVRVKIDRMMEERHFKDYLQQLAERLEIWREKQQANELEAYFRAEGARDLLNFSQGLDLLKELELEALESMDFINSTLGRVVESTSQQSRLQKELAYQEEVDLTLVVQAVLGVLEESWNQQEISHTFDILGPYGAQGPEAIVLRLEKVRLFNMIHNVLKNAGEAFVGFPSQDRNVHITLHALEGQVVMEVADNGKGIQPEDMDRIGEIGFSTKTSSEPGEGGSGLGVHNCKLFMSRIGGQFSLESKGHGLGSTVTLVFPTEVIA